MSSHHERQAQAQIRKCWPEHMLEFRIDGQLWAKPRKLGASWSVLLTRPQLQQLITQHRSEP